MELSSFARHYVCISSDSSRTTYMFSCNLYFSCAGMQLSSTTSSTTSRYTQTGLTVDNHFQQVCFFSGCQRFAPPDGGGFVCLNSEDTVYCSVQCDNTSEFSGSPFNPYRCGPATKFLWKDFTEEIYKQLPQCDGKYQRNNCFDNSFDF